VAQIIHYLGTSLQHDGDVKGKRSTVDEYLLKIPPSAVLHTGMDLPGPGEPPVIIHLPGTGEPHPLSGSQPQFAGITVDRLAVEPVGSASSRVRVYYSNDGRWVPPDTVDNLIDGYSEWSVSFAQASVTIPVAYKVTETFSDGGLSSTQELWSLRDYTFTETRAIIGLIVNLDTLTGNEINTIASQVNKIHTIFGYKYRFMAGDITPASQTKWRVEYSWEFDKGSVRPLTAPAPLGDGDKIVFLNEEQLPLINVTDADVWRDPFHRIEVSPVDDPRVVINPLRAARCWQIPMYAEEPSGHLTLPGFN
jgi:hypothetical protein